MFRSHPHSCSRLIPTGRPHSWLRRIVPRGTRRRSGSPKFTVAVSRFVILAVATMGVALLRPPDISFTIFSLVYVVLAAAPSATSVPGQYHKTQQVGAGSSANVLRPELHVTRYSHLRCRKSHSVATFAAMITATISNKPISVVSTLLCTVARTVVPNMLTTILAVKRTVETIVNTRIT
jgi:hypothetical protein